ncbi:MAG: hypothetical protein AMXMBFR59_17900 [Rhodanobacteraceae bacterium]
MADFTFLRPWWLLALAALPLLWFALRSDGGLQRSWARAVDAHLLKYLIAGREAPRRWPVALLMLGWLVACIALAGPAWERLPTPLYRNQSARVIALELNPSMLAADLKPSRLARARFAIRDLLDGFGDGQVALLGYAGDAFVVAPMTDDAATVRNLIGELDPAIMPVGGNATSVAIRRGVDLIHQSGSRGGDIILVCDAAIGDADVAAREAARQGVRVSVLAIGTAEGAPVSLPQGDFWKNSDGEIVVPRVDGAQLRAVATAGGGRFVQLDSGTANLSPLFAEAAPDAARDTGAPGTDSAQLRDRGPWVALLLLPLVLAGFRRGAWFALMLAVGLLAQKPAHALAWRDLWQRPDQQAWQSLQGGDAASAATLARDPDLRGAARFRAGDPAGAAADWASGASADAAYNFGNALAQQGQYEQAIAAWDEALRRDPEHADAQANKAAVEDWLRKQPQKSAQEKSASDKDRQEPAGARPDQPEAGNQDTSDAAQQAQDASAGEEGQQQDGKAGQQGEAAQSGQPGAQSQADDASRAAGETQQGQDQAGRAGKAKPGERDDTKAEPGRDTAPSADAKQQQAFQQAMERALQQGAKDGKESTAERASAGEETDAQSEPGDRTVAVPAETEAERERRQAVDQWLQRVPDDPGGLLRRKFQLEYERRQRGAQRGER